MPLHQPVVELPGDQQALSLAHETDTAGLMSKARQLRDGHFRELITYSPKIFIPLTQLCRDVCHYCTFAHTPKRMKSPYLTVEEVLEKVKEGAKQGCKEALFTLGEKPEARYSIAREALAEMKFDSTLDYLVHVAKQVVEKTGVLPHINAGCMNRDEMEKLRPVSASMGLMLETVATRLCDKGMPHYGSPDKHPERRLETLRLAGELRVPFTTGILIGIGETRRERIESLLAIRDLHQRYGHIQEVIIQNFRAKAGTKMAQAPEPDLEDLLWTIAVARLILGPTMNIQAPPNLSPGVLPQLIAAGINDWGGVSPVTPDFVNPEAPWPHLLQLKKETETAGKWLQQRLTIYPRYVLAEGWLDVEMHSRILPQVDADGYPRDDHWVSGQSKDVPPAQQPSGSALSHEGTLDPYLRAIVDRCKRGERPALKDVERLFQARGREVDFLCQVANQLRQRINGERVHYVVNRNINYTNVCYFKCQFCAFSKGKRSENLRGQPYDLSLEEIKRRALEAWQRGATEVCLQGGIHPDYTGQTYLDIVQAIKSVTPAMHVHAFSPLEVFQGAKSLKLSVPEFLLRLKRAGLGSLPGTAAEILDDEVRQQICADKLTTRQWLDVVEAAHLVGLRTTATIMFGHVDRPIHWARHLLHIRDLQVETGGFTEFVPLPFVAQESPMFLKGRSRLGPTFRETLLMHAVARLVLHTCIDNIQTSWVKMGEAGIAACLNSGANDLGGTLMNETITRAAGSSHGQEKTPQTMEHLIRQLQRQPYQRTTLYGDVSLERLQASFAAGELSDVVNTALQPSRYRDRIEVISLDSDVEALSAGLLPA